MYSASVPFRSHELMSAHEISARMRIGMVLLLTTTCDDILMRIMIMMTTMLTMVMMVTMLTMMMTMMMMMMMMMKADEDEEDQDVPPHRPRMSPNLS